eukprot:262543-Chlamydomonas_euryale.AAC.3
MSTQAFSAACRLVFHVDHHAAHGFAAQVEAHGQRLPLRSFGAVTQRNAHLLVVVPFDPAVRV